MDTSAPTPSVPPLNGSFLVAVEDALQEAFGIPFDLRAWGESWTYWGSGQSVSETPLSLGDLPEIREILEAVSASDNSPLVRVQSEGRFLLAVPIPISGDCPVVAVATLTMTPLELMQRLAASFQRELCQKNELQQIRGEYDSYAKQISEDFEGLAYLQGLAEHLELCEITRSVTDVAKAALPLLCELINAEALVFVTAEKDSEHAHAETDLVGTPTAWVGTHVLEDARCLELVDRFKHAAIAQPVVRNRLTERPESADFPRVKSFLLTRVAKDNYCAGWLLALNRTTETGPAEDQPGYPNTGLSQFEFGTVEAGLMSAASMMLATHERNVELFEEKEALLIGVLRALINAIDAKDSYTCGHSDRVALIAKRLGRELGLDEEQSEQMFLAGLLHDIGKIGVPDSVLLKPGKLTDEEFAQIKMHPQRGSTILKHLDHLRHVLPGVLHHHERFDGKGYPRGLAQEEIPLVARVIAVADSYDAMSSSRPYRKAMPEAKVESILREGAGTQWDDQVVVAFFRALPEIRNICGASEAHTSSMLGASEESVTGMVTSTDGSLSGPLSPAPVE